MPPPPATLRLRRFYNSLHSLEIRLRLFDVLYDMRINRLAKRFWVKNFLQTWAVGSRVHRVGSCCNLDWNLGDDLCQLLYKEREQSKNLDVIVLDASPGLGRVNGSPERARRCAGIEERRSSTGSSGRTSIESPSAALVQIGSPRRLAAG